MKYFIFGGPDPSSDFGCFEVCIKAPTKSAARVLLRGHLRELGRVELFKEANCIGEKAEISSGIFLSDVERRRGV